jgi:predicted  nucleic acid-binding Zn-ribbon protein
MEESILDFMWKNTPFTAICLGVAAFSGWAVYKFMRFNTRFEKTEVSITSRLDKHDAEIESLGIRITTVERRLDAVERRLDAVEIRLNAVEVRLAVVETKLDMVIAKVDDLGKKFDRLIDVLLVKKGES